MHSLAPNLNPQIVGRLLAHQSPGNPSFCCFGKVTCSCAAEGAEHEASVVSAACDLPCHPKIFLPMNGAYHS